jgi:hypothetical protein
LKLRYNEAKGNDSKLERENLAKKGRKRELKKEERMKDNTYDKK